MAVFRKCETDQVMWDRSGNIALINQHGMDWLITVIKYHGIDEKVLGLISL